MCRMWGWRSRSASGRHVSKLVVNIVRISPRITKSARILYPLLMPLAAASDRAGHVAEFGRNKQVLDNQGKVLSQPVSPGRNQSKPCSQDSHSDGFTRSGGRAFSSSRSEYTRRAICLTASAAIGTPERNDAPAPSKISGHGSSADRSSVPRTETASLFRVISAKLLPLFSAACVPAKVPWQDNSSGE